MDMHTETKMAKSGNRDKRPGICALFALYCIFCFLLALGYTPLI
jgi:hypothetical protein